MVEDLMAKMEISGLDDYIAKLDKLQSRYAQGYYGKAIYEGAKIVTDQIRTNIKSLPVERRTTWNASYVDSWGDANWNKNADVYLDGITATQKAGLLDGLGIAKMKNDGGTLNVRAGFHGYNKQKTRKFPNGQPNAMIARSVEGGTSLMQKHPFVAPAVRKTRAAAEAKMKEVIENGLKKIMEE